MSKPHLVLHCRDTNAPANLLMWCVSRGFYRTHWRMKSENAIKSAVMLRANPHFMFGTFDPSIGRN